MHSGWEKRNLEGTDKADSCKVCSFSRSSTCPLSEVLNIESIIHVWIFWGIKRSLNPQHIQLTTSEGKGWNMTLTRALPLKDDPGLAPSANTMAFHMLLHLVCAPFSLSNQVRCDGKTPKQLQRDKKWQTASVCVWERERGRERRGQKYKWGVGGGEQKQKQ